jgi:hypothetical protein
VEHKEAAMTSDVDSNAYDGQDGAEAFDEDNQGLDGAGENDRGEMRTFEEMPDVLDVTQVAGDADDDDVLIAEELDDEDVIELETDRDDADLEDDPTRSRFAEDAPSDLGRDPPPVDGEVGLDLQEDDGGPVPLDAEFRTSAADRGDAELDFTDDTDDEQETSTGRASRFEARTLSDDDLEDLGYRDDRAGGKSDS